MLTKELQKVLKEEWNLTLLDEDIDFDMTLGELSVEIACETENASLEEVFDMFIGHPNLHLPGIIAFTIISEMGLDPRKVSVHDKLGTIVSQKKVS